MSETTPDVGAADAATQPPYLAMASALRQQDVLDIAELAAMRVAKDVLMAGGDVLSGDTDTLTPEQMDVRVTLAKRVLAGNFNKRLLALGLMQAPDVAMAIAGNPSDAGTAMLAVDLYDAWRRNWTDYAMLQAATV